MEKLMEILKKIKPEIDFNNREYLVDEGVLDSIEIVEIIAEIEVQYSIRIDPEQIDPDNFQSAGVMWEMIQVVKNGSKLNSSIKTHM